MITIDGPISFIAGGAIALAGRVRGGDGIRDRDRLLWRGLMLQSLTLTPLILYFMVRFPDWEWNYMFDAHAFFFGDADSPRGPAVLAAMAALMNLSFSVGFRAVEVALKRGRGRAAQAVLAGMGIVTVAIMVAMHEQSLHLGTFAQFNAGEAPRVYTVAEFLITQGVAGALVTVGAVWALRPWLPARGAA